MKKLIKKISDLARKYGYSDISPTNYKDYIGKEEKGVKTIKLFADIKDPYKNTWVQIYESDGMTAVAYYYWSGPSGAWDPLEQWAEEEIWKSMTEEWD